MEAIESDRLRVTCSTNTARTGRSDLESHRRCGAVRCGAVRCGAVRCNACGAVSAGGASHSLGSGPVP